MFPKTKRGLLVELFSFFFQGATMSELSSPGDAERRSVLQQETLRR